MGFLPYVSQPGTESLWCLRQHSNQLSHTRQGETIVNFGGSQNKCGIFNCMGDCTPNPTLFKGQLYNKNDKAGYGEIVRKGCNFSKTIRKGFSEKSLSK